MVFGKEITTPELVEHVARDAVVTVSDGEKTVQLEGQVNLGIFPPYYFTTTQMKGEVGKTYTLRVEYQDYVATASTTIPQPVPIEKLYVDEIKDGLGTLKCCFTDAMIDGAKGYWVGYGVDEVKQIKVELND